MAKKFYLADFRLPTPTNRPEIPVTRKKVEFFMSFQFTSPHHWIFLVAGPEKNIFFV